MADGSRLPKVIVVLALLSRISTTTQLRERDDLLDRVRESKSNEPEVRDFLNSVLRQHDIFRWIRNEASKNDHDEGHHKEAGILPLYGVSPKNKRSFYSGSGGRSKSMTRYVYRHDDSFDDEDGDTGEVMDKENDMTNSNSQLKDDLDFDGPVNDIYPYQEAVAQQDRRFVRETQDSFLYDDQHFDDNDMLEGGLEMQNGYGEVDQGEADFSGEDRHDRSKRSASTEALLNEKLMLHRVLHKPINIEDLQDRFNRNGGKMKMKNFNLNSLAFHMPGDAIEIIPSSSKGVRNAPGIKLEKYGELVRSDQDRYNQEELEDMIRREDSANTQNVLKRKCTDNPVESDFKVDELLESNKSHGTVDIDVPLSDFYFSIPHDVIGLKQEVLNESRFGESVPCKKFRRDDQLQRDKRKNKNAIQIKILDNEGMVQDMEKGIASNSVILTIKDSEHSKDPVSFEPAHSVLTDRKTPDDTEPRLMLLPDDEDTRNTLTKIDNIIRHDQASLKLQAQTKAPKVFTPKTTDLMLSKAEVNLQSGERRDQVDGVPSHLGKHQALKTHARKYNRVNEMGTTIVPFISECSEYPQILTQYYKPQGKQEKVNHYQNSLEDLTEPTSAAEQRELGKINSVTDPTSPMIKTTSEKVIIIPFKKSATEKTLALEILVDSKLKNSDRGMRSEEERPSRDPPEKRSNDPEPDIDEDQVEHNDQPKADAFRSRKLFSFEDDSDKSESPADYTQIGPSPETPDPSLMETVTEEDRKKKDVRTALGMSNDQDYSEDKIDVFGDDERSQNKNGSKLKLKALEAKRDMETRMRQRLLGSIINSQQERRALKVRLAKTKNNKIFKKDTERVEKLDEDTQRSAQDHAVNNYEQVDIKDHEEDDANIANRDHQADPNKIKIVLHGVVNDPFDRDPHEQAIRKASTVKNGDRCCENVKTPPEGSIDPNEESPNYKTKDRKDKGNELDIIEKTQAILLHITGSPDREVDSDDGKKRDDLENPPLAVKHLKSYKTIDSDKNPENVVSEIIQLVQNYKNKVNEYNKNQNQNQKDPVAKSTDRPKVKLYRGRAPEINVSPMPDIEQDKKELVNSETQRNNKNANEFDEEFTHTATTDLPMVSEPNSNDINKVIISNNDDDDSSIHAHAIMHDKHLHPIKSNKCEHNQSHDNQEDFVAPKAVREGYVRTEVVADIDPVNDEDQHRSSPQLRDVESVTNFGALPADEEVKNEVKRSSESLNEVTVQNELTLTTDVIKLSKRDKPLMFTPDSLVVESSPSLSSELWVENDNLQHEVHKRDLHNDDKEYSEEELDKLIEMVDDSSKFVKHDQDQLKRSRRYKNFEPFYESLPRFRHSGSSPEPLTYATRANANDQYETPPPPSVVPICMEVDKEFDKGEPLVYHDKKHKRKHGHNNEIRDEEEFGDSSKLRADTRKKTKTEDRQERMERERIRGRLYEEREVEARKEQERIRNVLNGHLVLDIMLKFSNKVKANDRLNNRFGKAMSKKCACEQVELLDKFKDEQNRHDVRHAQLMLHQVIVLMNKIVAEQVHRRTCLILSPALKDFLRHTVARKQLCPKSNIIAEGYPLPAIKGGKKDTGIDDSQGDFLFPAGGDETVEGTTSTPLEEATKMRKKINMIKALLSKYDHMTHTCQIKVQPVHDYLLQHLHTLQRMYHNKNWGGSQDPCNAECELSQRTPEPIGNRLTNQEMTTIMTLLATMGGAPSDHPTVRAIPPGTVTATVVGPTVVAVPVLPPTKEVKTRGATFEPKKQKIKKQQLFRNYDDDAADSTGDNGEGEYPTDKYKKLVEAAANYRRKRQIEERLARLFGRARTKAANEVVATTRKLQEGSEADLSNAAFEAPMVYSLH